MDENKLLAAQVIPEHMQASMHKSERANLCDSITINSNAFYLYAQQLPINTHTQCVIRHNRNIPRQCIC